jgi:hypothetical protein
LSITMCVGGNANPFWFIFQSRILLYSFCFLPFCNCFSVSSSCWYSTNGMCSFCLHVHGISVVPICIHILCSLCIKQLCMVFFWWSVATCLLPTIANHYVLVAICSHAFEKSRQPCLLEEGPDHFCNDCHIHHIANRFFMPCASCF